jgi:hypothetical protein
MFASVAGRYHALAFPELILIAFCWQVACVSDFTETKASLNACALKAVF